jgi:hypothetical protein
VPKKTLEKRRHWGQRHWGQVLNGEFFSRFFNQRTARLSAQYFSQHAEKELNDYGFTGYPALL